MRNKIFAIAIGVLFLFASTGFAVETAPRISDREIIEGLAKLQQGQKNLEKRIDDLRSEMNGKFGDLRSEMNGKFGDLRSEMNGKFDSLRFDMNNRFDTLQWMMGLFIAIATAALGFILRMLWLMQRRQTATETSLETQKDEIAFLKSLIEKLLPPKGIL